MSEQIGFFILFFSLVSFLVIGVLQTTRNINETLRDAYKITSPFLKKLCWMRKNECLLAIPSIPFLIVGYLYLLLLVPYAYFSFALPCEKALQLHFASSLICVVTLLIEAYFTRRINRW